MGGSEVRSGGGAGGPVPTGCFLADALLPPLPLAVLPVPVGPLLSAGRVPTTRRQDCSGGRLSSLHMQQRTPFGLGHVSIQQRCCGRHNLCSTEILWCTRRKHKLCIDPAMCYHRFHSAIAYFCQASGSTNTSLQMACPENRRKQKANLLGSSMLVGSVAGGSWGGRRGCGWVGGRPGRQPDPGACGMMPDAAAREDAHTPPACTC